MRPSGHSAIIRIGLIFGLIAVYLCLVGIVETFKGRWIISNVLGLGWTLLLITGVTGGYVAARRNGSATSGVVAGGAVGLLTGAALTALLLVGSWINLRAMFVNASPGLYSLLAFDRDLGTGIPLLIFTEGVSGVCGALLYLMPREVRRTLLAGLSTTLLLSLFQDLLQLLLQGQGLPVAVRRFLFDINGPSLRGAAAVCVVTWIVTGTWRHRREAVRVRIASLPPAGQRALRWTWIALGVAGLLLIPVAGGPFVAQVMVSVGLFTLMGLGLNLEVGFAGLLDLGFVAFFAIGAYTVGLLTSLGQHGLVHFSFWAAIPFAVVVSLVSGVIFGIPVLRVRGDYLAIATLGLGEIVRLLVLSDALQPWLGGSFGILSIPRPVIAGYELAGPRQLYYLTLVASALAAYVAWRLQFSRLGRAWAAIREDEDVAQAIGIDLVATKLLAYGLGAVFAGIGGAIFAVMLKSIFPHSFQLLISINVLVLIILGGIGSLWGVVVGAVFLVGLPELLREFGEFRFLIYGAVLVAMMLLRPEGLIPSAVRQRELHEGLEEPAGEAIPAPAGSIAGAEGPAGG
ncbi:MAG TPA: branched-chain amino acid ABC transporter permease [bacterium]|nr:branched-chain amino acid ABC transporter permease [bacterium]